jgi:hypothetical protein
MLIVLEMCWNLSPTPPTDLTTSEAESRELGMRVNSVRDALGISRFGFSRGVYLPS